MKRKAFFRQLITFLLTGGLWCCSREAMDQVPDQRRPAQHLQANSVERQGSQLGPGAAGPARPMEQSKLPTKWETHLKWLKDRPEQREKFQKSILDLREEASERMFTIIDTIPEDACIKKPSGGFLRKSYRQVYVVPKREFLEDLSSFPPEEIHRLISIIIFLYGKNSTLIEDILKEPTDVSFLQQIKFYGLHRELPYKDRRLLDKLIEELKILNRLPK